MREAALEGGTGGVPMLEGLGGVGREGNETATLPRAATFPVGAVRVCRSASGGGAAGSCDGGGNLGGGAAAWAIVSVVGEALRRWEDVGEDF
ncbi:hypothetical protein ZWY2020_014527 [Hordeum vulgare]|nr:hypothetical protein ZWY2020_014527 [Hordeum vulgare]